MEPTGRREAPPDDRLRAIRGTNDTPAPGFASLHPGYGLRIQFSNSRDRHCEPTDRREAPSDDRLREAIQLSFLLRHGLLRCARNDVQIHLRDLAACSARVLLCSFRPLHSEGAGNAGRPMRPIAACAMSVVERTRVSQVTPESPGIPRAMVLRLMSRSPRRSGFFVTVIPEKLASQELDASVEASGPHDFAVRLTRRSSKALAASTASRPASVTIASRPSVGRDSENIEVIWVF